MRTVLLPSRQSMQGITLIEVLVAVVILSVGLLGLAGLQMSTLRNNQSAFERSRAIMAIYSITDIMRTDMGDRGALNVSSTFVTAQKGRWQDLLDQHLGTDASGDIDCTPTVITPLFSTAITQHVCTVTISWDDSLGTGGMSTHSVVAEVQL